MHKVNLVYSRVLVWRFSPPHINWIHIYHMLRNNRLTKSWDPHKFFGLPFFLIPSYPGQRNYGKSKFDQRDDMFDMW